MKKSIFIFLLSLILYSTDSLAQVYALTGMNLSKVRDNNLIQNKKLHYGTQLGVGVKYYPTSKNTRLSLINEIQYNGRGYEQQLDEKYKIKFNYLSVPFLMSYDVVNDFALLGGLEPSLLVSTNLEQGTKTYKKYDLGLVLGASMFDSHIVSLYTRFSYGMVPLLSYERMDKMGNFVENIHDVKNMCFTIGVKINFRNEKIKLYK